MLLFDVFGTGEVHTGDVQRAIFDPLVGRVVVFTSNFDPTLVEKAGQLGVGGYLSKALSGDELADAIEHVARGETVVSAPPDRSAPNRRRWPGQLHDLTEREAEVLALITQGYDNDAIATRLFISPNTLKSRIRTLYRKLGFENRVASGGVGGQARLRDRQRRVVDHPRLMAPARRWRCTRFVAVSAHRREGTGPA